MEVAEYNGRAMGMGGKGLGNFGGFQVIDFGITLVV